MLFALYKAPKDTEAQMKRIISVFFILATAVSFNLFAGAETLLGDADGNGRVTSNDAMIILQNTVGKRDDGLSAENCDVDGDGRITAGDALAILEYSVRRIYYFPKEDVYAVLASSVTSNGERYGEKYYLNRIYDNHSCSIIYDVKKDAFTVSYTLYDTFGKIEFSKDSDFLTSHITMSGNGSTVCWCQGDTDKRSFNQNTVINAVLNDHNDKFTQADYNGMVSQNAVKCISVLEHFLREENIGITVRNFGFSCY